MQNQKSLLVGTVRVWRMCSRRLVLPILFGESVQHDME